MSRSAWKPLYINPQYSNDPKLDEIRIQNRSTPFIKKMVGKTINIYNGIRWYTIVVSDEIIGQPRGQFAPTRQQLVYKKNKK
jgi:ribosomal protein S19